MNTSVSQSYVVDNPDDIPLHLKDRQPFILPNTQMLLRRSPDEVVGQDGRVKMAGAIEFQTTITPGILTDICDPEEIFQPTMRTQYLFRVLYDPQIQRGVKDTKSGPKEFLRPSEIDSMMTDIEANRFECPQLMWNFRTGETVWVYIRATRELRAYQGVATRPDTNHRHHAIIKTHRAYRSWVERTGSTTMGEYNPDRVYGLVIYTDDYQGEAHRFYVYNFLGWRVSSSTAHFIESKTDQPLLHSRLARELMERSPVLGAQNLEILSNHLSRNSAKMLTFGTLVDALKEAFSDLTEDGYEDVRDYLLDFINELGQLRPHELALLTVAQRQRVRSTSVADQAVLWHGYIRLAAWLRGKHPSDWKERLAALADDYQYVDKEGEVTFSGDLFSRENPLWTDAAVVAPGKKGPRVVNNRQARQGAFEALKDLISRVPTPSLVPAR